MYSRQWLTRTIRLFLFFFPARFLCLHSITAASSAPPLSDHTCLPGLLTLYFALHHCSETRRRMGPFPPPLDYDLSSLPIPHFLSLARGLPGGHALYSQLVSLSLDLLPDLFPPERLAGQPTRSLPPAGAAPTSLRLTGTVLEALKSTLERGPGQSDGELAALERRWFSALESAANPLALQSLTLSLMLQAAGDEAAW